MNIKLRVAIIVALSSFLFSSNQHLGAQQVEESLGVNQPSSQVVRVVEIRGNKVISTPTIMAKIKTRVGETYYPQSARDDIKRLFETGFFSDIRLELEDYEDGLKVIFEVEERPVIDEIIFEGNKAIGKVKLAKIIKSKTGQYLNLSLIKEDLELLRQEYEKRGFPDIKLDYRTTVDDDKNNVQLVFMITEGGGRVRIRNMYVDNNTHFSDSKILGLIKTRKKWLFNAGYFKEDQFNDDLERIKAFYLRNGFLDIKVDFRMDKDSRGDFYIRLILDEGRQYRVGGVSISGTEKFPQEQVRDALTFCLPGQVFSNEAMRDDIINIQSFYYGQGYIFVQVREATSLDSQTGKVDVSYSIVENDLAYVELIKIRGNTKTKDKVIRREMRIKPGERFDGDKLKRSKERLLNLGYFEEINYDTEPATESNYRNLVVDVKEARTGAISFGGGYSSIDQFVGFVEIEQKNFDWQNWQTFTGAGQNLKVRGEFGSVRQNYELSFTEPWLFDHPVSFGFDLYQREHDAEEDVGYSYSETRTGGDLRLGREFTEYIRGGMTYRLENVDISEVDEDASQDLKNEEGENLISSMEFSLTRDTTDNVFNPTRGLVLSGSAEVAGGPFGGDKDFTKFFGLVTQYFPVFAKTVLQLQARGGMAYPYDGQDNVPIYERFFAGGANTIRGYEERSVGPVDPITDDPLGGEALLIFNAEFVVPLLDFLKGAAFVDAGNVWAKTSEIGDGGLKVGIGVGVRVKTPIGPLKLDYGYPLDEQEGETQEGRVHFSMSHGF